MVIFTVIFSLFVKVKTAGIPYPIFSYIALVPWTFFSNSLTFGVPSLVTNSSLVSKIYFPREIFPLASVLGSFVDFLIASTILAGMLLYYHISPTLHVLWLPLIVFLQILFTSGILLVLSAANVFYRDIRLLLPFLLQIWMYVTPIIYPLSSVPARFRLWFLINPMTGLIDSYRRVVIEGKGPDFGLLGITAAVSIVVLVAGYAWFKRVEMDFADII
jgi:lipopolysaccharide transport system permease protein